MRPLLSLFARLAALFRRRRRNAEMSAELQAHIEALTERNIARGMTAEDARNAALREFGGVEQIKERCRDERQFRWLNETVRDARYAVRHFRRSPGFTAVAIASLAVAIGANTSIFSLLNAVLFKPAPTVHPEQLVLLSWTAPKWPVPFSQTGGDARFSFSYPAFKRLLAAESGIHNLFAFVPAAFGRDNLTVVIDGRPTLATGLMVTGQYFSGLTVKMAAGRGITEADEAQGRATVAVISDAFWAAHFNRARNVIGRTVMVNTIPCTIVGVASAGFYGMAASQSLTRPDLWLPFTDAPTLRPWGVQPVGSQSIFTAHDWICLNLIGRVPQELSAAAVEGRLNTAFQSFVAENWTGVRRDELPRLKLVPCGYGLAGIPDMVTHDVILLMAGVALLLVVACANLATLLLARADSRQREISVRAAIGASRARLVRQLLTESVLLSVGGGAVGLLIAIWGDSVLAEMVAPTPSDLPLSIAIDGWAFGFVMLISLGTGMLFGLVPSLRATRLATNATLQTRSSNSRDRRSQWLGRLLIAAQLALSLVLVICAGLFVRTLRNMEQRDLGFDGRGLLVFGIDPTRAGYRGDPLLRLYERLRTQIAALPAVAGVTLYGNYPFTGSNNGPFRIEGITGRGTNPITRWDTVGPDFCRTMGIRLVAGRDILPRDAADAPKVGLVNEEFARHFLHGENPIGRRFIGPSGGEAFEIVGVIRDAELTDLHAKAMPKAYVPYCQLPLTRQSTMFFEVRTTNAALATLPAVRVVVHDALPTVPLLGIAPQTEVTGGAMFAERLFARLAGLFGVAAVLVSCIGVYGTTAYQVTRRTAEIGIRMALGASPRAAVGLIVGQGLVVISIGLVAGIALSLAATGGLRGVLYGVGPTDPVTFVIGGMAMILIGLLASWLPARRAANIDPVEALRAE